MHCDEKEDEKALLLNEAGNSSGHTASKGNVKNKECNKTGEPKPPKKAAVAVKPPGNLPVFAKGRFRSVTASDVRVHPQKSRSPVPKDDQATSARPKRRRELEAFCHDVRSSSPSVITIEDRESYSSKADASTTKDAISQDNVPQEPTASGPVLEAPVSIPDRKPNLDSSSSSSNELDSTSASESNSGTFSLRSLSAAQKFLLLNVLLSDFLTSCCLSLLAPFFPQEAQTKNVSDSISGWIFGVYSLTQFVFAPICGKMMPKIGGKFMYLAGGFWSGGCTVLFGFLDYVPVEEGGSVTFISLCFVLRVVLAIGCTGLQTAGFAYSFNEFPNSIATVFGIMEVFVGLGSMAGPALGGLLYGAGGFYLPFIVVGGLILASVPINYCFLPELEYSHNVEEEGSVLKLLKMPSIVVMNIVVVVGAVIWSILDPTLEPRLMEFALSPAIIGLIFLLMSAFYALTAPLWGRCADKMEDNKLLLIPGFAFSAIGMLLLGPSPIFGLGDDYNELWLNVLSLCLLGMSSSLAIIPSFDVFLDFAETAGFQDNANTYGIVAGLWSSAYALGDFIGPSIGGVLLTSVGFQMCMTYTAVACAVVVVLLVIMEVCERCQKGSRTRRKDVRSGSLEIAKDEERKSLLHQAVDCYATNPYLRINSDLPWTDYSSERMYT